MNNTCRRAAIGAAGSLRSLIWMAMLAAVLLAAGCGGESAKPENKSYAALSEDVEQQLKFDARVQDYETDGDRLVVNVNDDWLASPPGMQERAMGQWFSLWSASRSNEGGAAPRGLQLIVRHDGNDVARWTTDRGFEPIQRKGQTKSES